MAKYSFFKMNGAGNDFILVDVSANRSFPLTTAVISKLCARRTGIGADGLLAYLPGSNGTFHLEYFNADGGKGSLCGNGSRCSIWYHTLAQQIPFGTIITFTCNGATYTGRSERAEEVTFWLLPPAVLQHHMDVELLRQSVSAAYADTGSPHVVIDAAELPGTGCGSVEDFNVLPVAEWGNEIRYSKAFAPGGTNVNFVYLHRGRVYIRTYERGVEDETLACGTGCTAAALLLAASGKCGLPVSLVTQGGRELAVNAAMENGTFTGVSLTGHAAVNFTGTIEIDTK